MLTHHGFFVFIGFDASDEEGITLAQCLHQRLQGLFKLRGQSWCSFPCLRPHVEILTEQSLQELVLRDVNQLQQVGAEGVPVLLQEVPGVVEDDPCEVVESEGSVDVRLRLEIVPVVSVFLVEFVQHGLVRSL